MATGGAIEAGKAFIRLTLMDADAKKSLEDFGNRMDAMAGRLTSVGARLTAFGAALGAPLAIGVRNLLGFTSALDFSSRRLGIAAGELARFEVIGRLSGITLETLEIGLKTMGERLVQLRQGSQDTASAFRYLGISIDDYMNAGDNTKRFLMLAEAMSKLKDAGERAGYGLALFGEAGLQLSPVFALGPAAIRRMAEELGRFATTQRAVDAARELRVEWTLMTLALRNLSVDMASTVAPALTSLIRMLNEVLVAVRVFVIEHPNISRAMAALGGISAVAGGFLLGAAAIAKFASVVVGSVKAIGALVTAMAAGTSIATVFWAAAAGYVGVIVAAIGAFVGWQRVIYLLNQGWSTMATFIGIVAKGLGQIVSLIPGLRSLGSALQQFGDRTITRNAEFLQLSYEEFKKLREGGAFGNISPDGSLTGAAAATPSFTSAGIIGGYASQQTLGLAGVQSVLEQGISKTANNTDRMVELLEEQNRRRAEFQAL